MASIPKNDPHVNASDRSDSPLAIARSYVARGWNVTPVKPRSKAAVLRDFPDTRLSLEDLPRHFSSNGVRPNIGVVLGPSSGGLVDADLDDPLSGALAARWLPPTGAVFGRPGKPRSHWLYRLPGDAARPSRTFKRPLSGGDTGADKDTRMLLELRSSPLQTVFPGSTHPSGEPIAWELDGEPALIEHDALLAALGRIAAGALLAHHWVQGVRNELTLAVSGALLRAGWSPEETHGFIKDVAAVAGDADERASWQRVESTAAKLAAGEQVTGLPTLASQMGDPAVKLFATWLGLQRAAPPAAGTGADAPPAGAPAIDAGEQDLRIITGASWAALYASNEPARLFHYGGMLVRLERAAGGQPQPSELTIDRLRHEMARIAAFYRVREREGVRSREAALPPLVVIRDMLATPEPKLPWLARVVDVPVFSAQGELQTAPGYHAGSRTFYAPALGCTLPPVSAKPTAAEVARALSLLFDEVLVNFEFVGAADKAHAVALLFEPFVRDMIAGPTPLHLIEAPTPGSGKGLLADVLLFPAVGRALGVIPQVADDDEMRKQITSRLLEARPAILLDNLTRTLSSAVLAAALTSTSWSDRPLGRSETVELPVRCAWVATGNNPTLSTEIARRVVRSRLDPGVDRPWTREGFHHKDLHAWVAAHRAELVWAALTMARAWIAQGQPAPSCKPLGSYERWSHVLGGILETAGIPGFLTNLDEFYETADSEGTMLRQFVALWWERYKDNEVKAADLLPLSAEVDGFALPGKTERAQQTAFGTKLAALRDRVIGDYRVLNTGKGHHGSKWRLLPARKPPTPGNATTPSSGAESGETGNLGNLGEPPSLTRTRALARTHAHTHTRMSIHTGPQRFPEVPEVPQIGVGEPAGAAVERGENIHPHSQHSLSPGKETAMVPPARPLSVTVGASYPEMAVWALMTHDDVARALGALMAAPVVGLDTETTGLDPLQDRLRLVQLATPAGVYLLDTTRVDPRGLAPLLSAPAGGGPLLVAHNSAFDLRFLERAGLEIPSGARLFDTMLASQLLTASADKAGSARLSHGLSALAARALGVTLDKSEQKADWSAALSAEQCRYAALDASVLLPLAERLRADLRSAELERVAALEMGAIPTVAWLMQTGVPFDGERWAALADAATNEQSARDAELTVMASTEGLFAGGPGTVSWSSPKQVSDLLRARGHVVKELDEPALRLLADAGEPLAQLLLRHRDASKRASTYGRDYLKHVHPVTGRIHARFLQLGSQAGRMSAASPNVQQVPRAAAYRACVRPGAGRVLIKADYAQIELRCAAEIAPDERLIAAFARGDDLHTVTARTVLGKTEVSKADRQAAKAVNFGLLYGMGAPGLREYAKNEYGVSWSGDEAEAVRSAFFAQYRGLRAWHSRQPRSLVDTRTVAGRRRLGVDRFTEKLNTPVQGSAADGMKAALGLLWETRHQAPSAAPVLVVHDEIVVECDQGEVEQTREWVRSAMRAGMETVLHRVPAEVEAIVCSDWSGTPVGVGQGQRGGQG